MAARKRRARRLRDTMDGLLRRHRATRERRFQQALEQLQAQFRRRAAERFQGQFNAAKGIHEAPYVPPVLRP